MWRVWAHNGLRPRECFHQRQLISISPHSGREPGAAQKENHHCPSPEDLIFWGTSWTNREWPLPGRRFLAHQAPLMGQPSSSGENSAAN